MPYDPVVFISSTSDDLKEHREQAAKAALANGLSPRMMEYFPASGHAPTLAACLEKVAEAEVVVVLVAHRYGWVPDGPENPDAKSITWLECDYARRVTKKEVLAFLVDPDYPWPAELREDYRLIQGKNAPAPGLRGAGRLAPAAASHDRGSALPRPRHLSESPGRRHAPDPHHRLENQASRAVLLQNRRNLHSTHHAGGRRIAG